MSAVENKVRTAANALHDAIKDARAKGYKVEFPHHLDGLLSIAISETGKAKPVAKAIAASEPTGEK
jgi:DNA-binding IclR family transcriptional regulator